MIRLPSVTERGFLLALIGSAAIHAALLPVLLSFRSESVPGHIRPFGESCIRAFLVPGTPKAGGNRTAQQRGQRQAGQRDRRGAQRLPPEMPEAVAPAEKGGVNLHTDVLLSDGHLGMGRDTGALHTSAFQASGLPGPEGAAPLGNNGAGIAAVRRGAGEFGESKGAGGLASRREGSIEIRQKGSGAWPLKDIDAVPRYGDNAHPSYPPLARLRGYQGVVVLLVQVLADGCVGQASIRRSAGHEILDRAALEAVRNWRFEPGRREGRPVIMSVEVPVRFALNGNAT